MTDSTTTDELFRVLAHDLLNSLTVIGGYAATLRVAGQNGSTDLALQCADVIERHSSQMEGLIRASQDVRLLDRQAIELALAPLDLGALVTEAVDALGRTLQDRTVSVVGADADPPLMVMADPVRLRQALSAVIANAAKFSPEGTPIEVAVGADGGAAWVTVRDEGPGIPSESREKVFEKFGRVSHRVPGSGLNLYLARGISRLHGGDLVLTAADDGATFCFNLPLAASHAEGAHER